MKEFIEKLIGRLEEKENETVLKAPNTSDISDAEYQKWMMKSYGFKESIEIVNELTEEYRPKTQADKIRSMSDEELAELFAQYSCEDADYTSLLPIKDCKWGTKQEVIDRNLKWLQSEA